MKRIILFTLLILPFVWGSAEGQVISKNMALADFVSYQTLYNGQSINPADKATLADVASWKDIRTGKEYALVCLKEAGSGSGVALVDVTNPGISVYVKTIRYPHANPSEENALNTPADVKVYNDVAFVAQNSQPTYWVKLEDAVDSLSTPTAGYQGDITSLNIHNLFVNTEQKLLFLSYFTKNKKIQVYDISGLPTNAPVFEGEIAQLTTDARSHDLYARKTGSATGRVFDATLRSLTVSEYTWSGGTFTVTDQWVHQYNPYRGVNPYDFSGNVIPEDKRIVHTAWLGAGNDYLFTTEEQGGGSNSETYWINPDSIEYKRGNYLYSWDINPVKPTADANNSRYPIEQVYEVRENSDPGSFASSNFSLLSSEKANSIHNIVTRGTTSADTAFISYYTKGIRVLDVTNPTNMSEMAYYDVPGVMPNYFRPVLNGAWGVDPFLPSGIILASSSDGLYVFHKVGTFAGTIDVNTRWTGTITVTGNVTVQNNATLTISAGTTVAFANGKSLTVNAGSKIIAIGTVTQTIKFSPNTPVVNRSEWEMLNLGS